jgi:outer membrane protein assembly factor BamB
MEQPAPARNPPHALEQIVLGDWRAAPPAGGGPAARPSRILTVISALRGKRRLPWLVLGAVALVLITAGAVFALFGKGGDISNSGVAFVDTSEDTPVMTTMPAGRHPADDRFRWPIFGFTKARTHNLPLRSTPRPPWQEAWAFRGSVLLEFNPVLCGRSLFLLKNNGMLYALSRTDGRVRWRRKLGKLAASSPACDGSSVYAVLLSRRFKRRSGLVTRLSARSGKRMWTRRLPSRAESSPLLDKGRLYFGSENGTVYSLRARDGAVRWKVKATGAVKGALALDSGKLYFGDYGGKVTAIRRSDGKRVWRASASAGGLNIGESNLYSSAAVQYGRVYIGSTNGNVYSFSTADGKLAWRKSTGDYVYASPAVGRVAGRPTVYIGSYSGRFYALDARNGRVRWSRSLGSKISGGATIIGDLVWVSDLGKKTTWALSGRTGKTVYKTRRGAFHPAISDGRRIYFSGYSSLFALDPKNRPFDSRAASILAQRAAIRKRIARRAALREYRQRKYRTRPHGHAHKRRKGRPPPRCHRHAHVYRLRGRLLRLVHNHCHTHAQRR